MQSGFLRNFTTSFAKDESGGVLIYTALASTVMLGMVGLAVDLGYWYQGKRDMQSAADAAVMAAVFEMARGSTTSEVQSRAKDIASLNGYAGGDVSIYLPPQSGVYAGNADYVEAVVSQPLGGFLSSIVHPGGMPVSARAVGTFAGAPACVLALNPTATGAITIQGNTSVTLDCGAQSNSTASPSIEQVGGSADLTATSVQASGTSDCDNCSPTPNDNMPQAADPFSYLSTPDTSVSCTETATLKLNTSTTLNPGYYCGGIEVTGGTITFNEGTYLLGGVGLRVTGNAHLRSHPSGDGQVFFITDSVKGKANRALFIAGTVSADLRAPESGDYDGVLVHADPGLKPNLDLVLTGGPDMELTGVVYAPGSHVQFSGNAAGTDTWTAVVSDTVAFSGDSTLQSAGYTGGRMPLALTSPSLAE